MQNAIRQNPPNPPLTKGGKGGFYPCWGGDGIYRFRTGHIDLFVFYLRSDTVFSPCPLCLCGEKLRFAFPGFQNEAVKELVIRGPAGRGIFFLLNPGQKSLDLRIQVIHVVEKKGLERLGEFR